MFSLLFQTNGQLYEIAVIMTDNVNYEAVYFTEFRQKETESLHEFCLCSIWHMFLCSGLFLEVSRHLFLPELSKFTKRSEFLELLFTAASNYRNQGGNSSCLPAIPEPVWLYLRAFSQRGQL